MRSLYSGVKLRLRGRAAGSFSATCPFWACVAKIVFFIVSCRFLALDQVSDEASCLT